MKKSLFLLRAALILLICGSTFLLARPSAAQDDEDQSGAFKGDDPYSQPDQAKRAQAYYDFTMGHLNEVYYITTSRDEFATAAIEFYKKAYELDPETPVIGEHLAEMYYQARRTRDAVLEAQAIIAKNPKSLSARKLLVRIYLRTLGDLNGDSAQRETATRAIEQLEEIRKIDPNDKDSAVWLARLYRVRGENRKAEDVLQSVLAHDPTNPASVEQLAQIYMEENRARDAAKLLEDSMKQAPKAGLLDLLGDAYAQLHDPANSEKAYRASVALEPDEPTHRAKLAQALTNAGKYEEALAVYKEQIAADPDDPDNYFRVADLNRRMHKLDDAEQAILQAKQRAPGNPEVIYLEAMIYQDQGRFDDAIRVLSSALSSLRSGTGQSPSNRRTLAVLYEQLGQMYREVDNNTAALNTLKDLAALGPEEEKHADLLIIDLYSHLHDTANALDAAEKAVAKFSQDRELRITRSLLVAASGDPDKAAGQLREMLGHNANDFDIYVNIAQVYQQNKRYPDAEAALAQATPLASSENSKEMLAYALGGVYESQKKYDQAEEQFKRAIALNPRDAGALNYYGYMLADRGVRLGEATDLIKRALAEDPNNGAFLDSLGWAYYKQDKLAEAEDTARQAVSHERHDPTILEHLGDIYFKRGKVELAAAQWQRSLDEWHKSPAAEAEPDKIAAVEGKLSNAKRRIAEQGKKSGGPGGQY
ncbi:MAG TPA: tetratricopeptide repeat protein [Candidatus Acidoferrales bacterium]|nr:tetratricopeptide repeat protein [Candidatus Acidoferrales bacterium]